MAISKQYGHILVMENNNKIYSAVFNDGEWSVNWYKTQNYCVCRQFESMEKAAQFIAENCNLAMELVMQQLRNYYLEKIRKV